MQSDLTKQNMWNASITVVSRSLTIFLMVVAAITFFAVFVNQSGAIGLLTTFIWSYLAYAAHAVVLKNASSADLRKQGPSMGQFVFRTYVLALVPALLLFPALIVGFQSEAISKEASTLLYLAFAAPLYLVAFGLFGTTLPAVVMGEDFGFSRSFKRGLKTFMPTVGKLIIGPGVLIAATAAFVSVYPLYTGNGRVFDTEFNFYPLNLVPEVIFAFVGGFATVQTAVILSTAYVTGEEEVGALAPPPTST